jgi:microcystin-dependent protein
MAKVVSRADPIEPVYLNNLAVASMGWGVLSGMAVSQRGAGANMSVDVAAGNAMVNGTMVIKSSTTNVSVTAADATYDRYDLVVLDSSGTISVVAGTAGSTSYANDYDLESNDSILLAELFIEAGSTTVTTSDITDKRIISQAFGTIPAGAIMPYGGSSAPGGWLLCDGSAVSRTTYATLFAAIGTAYGAGDGSTTFNLPDMQGNVPVGIGGSGVTSLGDTGGEQEHVLTISEMPSHRHTDTLYLYALANSTGRAFGISGSAQGSSVIASDYTGGDAAHNNMQPYMGVNYIIKV